MLFTFFVIVFETVQIVQLSCILWYKSNTNYAEVQVLTVVKGQAHIIPSLNYRFLSQALVPGGRGGGILPYITYTGMCHLTGLWFWSFWFRTGCPFQRRFLERGIIFRTHESSSFVSSHLKLFKDRLLLKIRFNALTSKLLYSCCTLCFSVQGGRILARAASADSAILDK